MKQPSPMNQHAPCTSAPRFGAPPCWTLFALCAVPVVAMAAFALWLMAPWNTPAGGLLDLAALGMYLMPPAWGLAIASAATALVRTSRIKRHNREHGASERGVVSATVCACLSAFVAAVLSPGIIMAIDIWGDVLRNA